MNLVSALSKCIERAKISRGVPGLIRALALLFLLLPGLAHARTGSPGQEQRPLGSLSTIGEVYVNNSLAPAESTIFSGDTLQTSATGSATFSMSGKGSFKIAPQSQLVFTGELQYVAELKSGMVVMSSFGGATDIILRAGNFTVAPVIQGEQSASKIAREPDGSFSVACLDGSVGVIPLEGGAGRFLQSGQSVSISPEGQLVSPQVPAAPPAAPPQPSSTTPVSGVKKKSNTGWILLGVAGAGAVGIGAAAGGHGGGGTPPVSP